MDGEHRDERIFVQSPTKVNELQQDEYKCWDGYEDDRDAAVDHGDDAQASKDSDDGEDWCPSATSPSRSLPKVRFMEILVSMNVRYVIHLHGVKVFNEAVLTAYGTSRRYEQALAILIPIKSSDASFLDCFLGGSRIIIIKALMAFNQHIFFHN
jgi:hypothetical protein